MEVSIDSRRLSALERRATKWRMDYGGWVSPHVIHGDRSSRITSGLSGIDSCCASAATDIHRGSTDSFKILRTPAKSQWNWNNWELNWRRFSAHGQTVMEILKESKKNEKEEEWGEDFFVDTGRHWQQKAPKEWNGCSGSRVSVTGDTGQFMGPRRLLAAGDSAGGGHWPLSRFSDGSVSSILVGEFGRRLIRPLLTSSFSTRLTHLHVPLKIVFSFLVLRLLVS